MQLFNALSLRKETFAQVGDKVTVYVCGVTPYDTTHIGHVFTYATFDILIRYLEYNGFPVLYAQNVTDIDDDILRKAREGHSDWRSLGNHWTTHFIDDSVALNIRAPEFYPRATDVIPEIVKAVQELISAGLAYESAGNIYFQVKSNPEFGKLSRLTYEEMLPIANERGNNPDDPHKYDPLDFVLWQAQAPGEPSWPSPWGPGRPGWHIECSTMSDKYLGQPIDIHGGGADLLFPHHESEIAQAECASGRQPFTRFWMHVGMVHYQGEKMSKSLGNLVMARDLLENGYQADAIRLCMSRHHYRQAWNYDQEELDEMVIQSGKLRQAVSVNGGNRQTLDSAQALLAFHAAMDDDLNTPLALAVLDQLADQILVGAQEGRDLAQAQEFLRITSNILGLQLSIEEPDAKIADGWRVHRKRFQNSKAIT